MKKNNIKITELHKDCFLMVSYTSSGYIYTDSLYLSEIKPTKAIISRVVKLLIVEPKKKPTELKTSDARQFLKSIVNHKITIN
ncbi:hypothetical protein [Tenacibaculum finnmarkense]|uniref:hypothetical protein n=1 Tax=Tenacibaculum finnmarkense TaxID=2781243 RepID=UPI001559190A|nr:hypothetical protein [Tenacibaculum finnmarkense]MBE7697140.1 hypothetical protein [Tenacibaculum finnmarkense genomovar ulcerans]